MPAWNVVMVWPQMMRWPTRFEPRQLPGIGVDELARLGTLVADHRWRRVELVEASEATAAERGRRSRPEAKSTGDAWPGPALAAEAST